MLKVLLFIVLLAPSAVSGGTAAPENPAQYKPSASDGRVFVQSEPAGAKILLAVPSGRAETGSRTPALVQVPRGEQKLFLELAGMRAVELSVNVGDAIVKLDSVKFEPIRVPVDIIFEDGWLVFIDGKHFFS